MQDMKIIVHRATQDERTPVCGYARVTTDKDEQAESYHLQDEYWTTKLQAEPQYQFVGMFGDEGVSGATQRKRLGFLEMIKLCKLGKVKIIFTKSVARFGRNARETLLTVKELRELGVAVVFENDGINTAQLNDALMLRLKAILAEEELKTMSNNQKWAARKRFAEGSVELARIYGYDLVRDGRLVSFKINETEAKIVREIYELFLSGLGLTAIANILQDRKVPTKMGGIWQKSTLGDIIRNEKYMGDARLQKTFKENGREIPNKGVLAQPYVENNHAPIIDEETFRKVQEERIRRASKLTIYNVPELTEFSGKIKCHHCGKGFTRRINNHIVNFDKAGWMCRTQNDRGIDACPHSMIINEGLLKEITLDAFNEYLATPKINDKTAEIKAEIQQLVGQEQAIRMLWQNGTISYAAFTAAQAELKDKYKACEERLAEEQGFELYTKEGKPTTEYTADIVNTHIDKIVMKGFKIRFFFKNKQEIEKEFIYAHRRYRKAY